MKSLSPKAIANIQQSSTPGQNEVNPHIKRLSRFLLPECLAFSKKLQGMPKSMKTMQSDEKKQVPKSNTDKTHVLKLATRNLK